MNLRRPYGRRDEPSAELGDRFFLGVDERRPANQLPEGYVSAARNKRFRQGKAETRLGVQICRWMKDTGETPFQEVYGAIVFADPNQAGDWMVVAADGGVWKTRPNMAATVVPLPGTVSLTRETFRMFVPCTDNGDSVLVLLRGDDADPLVCVNLDIGFIAVPDTARAIAITSASTTATVTLATHGYSTGDDVVIEGATQTEYNGTYEITVTDSDHFTYTFAGSGTTPATGSPTVRLPGRRDMPRSRFGVNHLNRLLLIEGRDGVGASDLLAYQDFLAAQNEFRINTGQSDQLERIQPLIGNRLLMFKTQSVLEVQNVGADLSLAVGPLYVTNKYGLVAPLGCALNGSNCYWMTGEPAVASLRLTELNETQDTDVRLSDALSQTFGRIHPLALAGVVMEVWDGKLYVALPLDDATVHTPTLEAYGGRWEDGPYVEHSVRADLPNWFELGNATSLTYDLENGDQATRTTSGWFTPASGIVRVYGEFLDTWTGFLSWRSPQQTNNAIAVYDFLNQAWCGTDEAPGVFAVKAFLKTTYQGRQRLFSIGSDGVIRLHEEGYEDEVYNVDNEIEAQAISDSVTTRAYQVGDRQRFLSLAVLLRTWNPNYSITTVRQDYNRTETVQPDVTRSRTEYDRHDATAWDAGNAAHDHGEPGRFDYSVVLPTAGMELGSAGVNFDAHQVSTERVPLSDVAVYQQLRLTNTAGRCELLQIGWETQAHEQRSGAEVN